MRKLPAFAATLFLAATPCMAQVIIGGGNDAARHEDRADQQRDAARHDMHEAHEKAERGDYQGAARERNEARAHREAAHDQERRADRDSRDRY